ncbi:MAG: META domain-containing protein [Acidobacteria bacterium]|jgi:heat shock protein HslJ|nr:META domain-containing protein [Acidobacteriota bacterium]
MCHHRFSARLLAPALAAAALAACATTTPVPDAPSLEGTAWVLSALPGRTLVADHPATLRFEGGNVAGSDGCNRFSGTYGVKGPELKVSTPLASTMMACPPPVDAQAKAFVAALTGAARYRVAEGRLELLAADGKLLATLERQAETLAGTAWRVTGINNGRQAVVSVLAGTAPTLAFGTDGRASGSAGCNNFNAGYTADGSKVAITEPASTRKMCAEPAGVMEQEQQFLAALATVATARVEGDRLELRRADGALAVSATKDAGK